jgi:ABC-2 type transport system ATP-binding protein
MKDTQFIQDKLSEKFPDMSFIFSKNNIVRVEADKPILAGAIVRFLEEQGIDVSEARRLKPSLEDVFIQITGIESDALKKEKEKQGMGGKS